MKVHKKKLGLLKRNFNLIGFLGAKNSIFSDSLSKNALFISAKNLLENNPELQLYLHRDNLLAHNPDGSLKKIIKNFEE